MSEKRNNIAPFIESANHPEKYDEIPKVDVVYQDIAQRDQVGIFLKNYDKFLKKDGFGLLCIKARSIDVTKDPKQILKLFEQAGLPIDEDYLVTIDNVYNDPHGQYALGNATLNKGGVEGGGIIAPNRTADGTYLPTADIGGGPVFNDQVMGSPPMDDPIYDSMARDIRGGGNPFVPTNYKRSNQSQDWNYGRDYE